MTNFYTADLHLNHPRISIYEPGRQIWQSLEIMNRRLISNINDTVNSNDTLYILGDFCWDGPTNKQRVETFVRKIKCNIVLVLGNHDRLYPMDYIDFGVRSVHTSLLTQRGWYLIHDPAWALLCPKESVVLFGHVHSLYKTIPNRKMLNVGVDVWDYKPVSEEEIEKELEGV